MTPSAVDRPYAESRELVNAAGLSDMKHLRGHFDDARLVELSHIIALENMRGRFNLALGITAAGFSEGGVCAVPVHQTS